MSQPNEQVITELISAVAGTPKCTRIPPKTPQSRYKYSPKQKITEVNAVTNQVQKKNASQVGQQQPHSRFTTKNVKPREDQPPSRPRSGSQSDADRAPYQSSVRMTGKAERVPNPKNAFVMPRRMPNDNKFGNREQNQPFKKPVLKPVFFNKRAVELPDQETIRRIEENEVQESYDEFELVNEKELLSARGDSVVKLKSYWNDSFTKYEKTIEELDKKQNTVMEMYKKLKDTHKKLAELGQDMELPSLDNLQFVKLSETIIERLEKDETAESFSNSLSIDLEKLLYKIPSDVLAVCEDTIMKRKIIIDWLDSLVKSRSKGISMGALEKKVNEFSAENEMLKSSVLNTKEMFMKNLDEIAEFIRSRITDVMAMQLRQEELTFEVSKLHSQNVDLQKQLANAEALRSQNHELKIEKLKKELEDEKSKKAMIRDHLIRAEGQVKASSERATQLEAALDEVRSHNWSLERSVQQLSETNQKLQADYNIQLNNLHESLKTTTSCVEEITKAREQLQKEKEDLENRYQKIIDDNVETIKKLTDQFVEYKSKYEAESNKFKEEEELRIKLEKNIDNLSKRLLDEENKAKELKKQLELNIEKSHEAKQAEIELKEVKILLDRMKQELDDSKTKIIQQNETLKEAERKFNETSENLNKTKRELSEKLKRIESLEQRKTFLEDKLHENESKMESYEEQLSSIKTQISQMQEEFGEFENLAGLRDMVNEQRSQLIVITRESNELSEELQEKTNELESRRDTIAEQIQLLEQKDGIIKMLTEKEAEQSKIAKLLRNNLENRTKMDRELNEKLEEKDAEIQALTTNKNQQISQLEKIILQLEEQIRKNHVLRRQDQEKINALEIKLNAYESYHVEVHKSLEGPVDNLDNLIQMLENELGSPFEQFSGSDEMFTMKRDFMEKTRHDVEKMSTYSNDMIDKKVESMKTINKKKYAQEDKLKSEKLDRKKAITSIDTPKVKLNPSTDFGPLHPTLLKEKFSSPINSKTPKCNETLSRNVALQLFSQNLRDEKKSKMFKIAGHKLYC